MPWQQIISIAKDIASILSGLAAFAAFIAAFVAWRGLKSWRDQLAGRTEYELARRLLRAVYKVRDTIQLVRNPAIFNIEIIAAREDAGINDQQTTFGTSAEDIAAVYTRRWSQISNAMSDLEVESLEAEVLWGLQVVQELKPLRQCVTKLQINLRRYIGVRQDPETWKGTLTHEQRQEMDNVIYYTSDDPQKDNFSGEIFSAVQSFDNFIRPFLKLTK